MKRYVVSYQREPYNFHEWVHLIVEAATPDAAILVVRDSIRDLDTNSRCRWRTKDYVPPPPGRILGVA